MTTPNALSYEAKNVAEVAAADLKNVLPLAQTFTQFGDSDFVAGRGSSLYLNVGAALVAHERALIDVDTAIVFDAISEQSTPITLDKSLFSAVKLSDGDLRLGLQDFTRQILKPQNDAIAAKLNAKFSALVSSLTEDASIAYNATAPVATFTQGRAALRAKGLDVASANLVAIVGANVADALLDSGALDFDKTGDASALRNGSVGRVRGFNVIESALVDDDAIVYTHDGGIFTAWATPEVTPGMAYAATARADGSKITARYVREFSIDYAAEKSLVSTLATVGVTPTYAITRDDAAGTATASLVDGGQVVLVNTAA